MKLANHVPHKLKKRTLKRLGVPVDRCANSIQYYTTLKILKMVNLKAYSIMKDRLRIRGVLKMRDDQGFTGRMIAEFRWMETPEGPSFWSNVDKQVLAHQYDNAFHKRRGFGEGLYSFV